MVLGPYAIMLFNKPISQYMINMTMCINIPNKFQIVLTDEIRQPFPFLIVMAGCIDNNGFTGPVIQKIAIHQEGVEREYFDVHTKDLCKGRKNW
jgi:hypothetical protein